MYTEAITKKDFINLSLTPSTKGKENRKQKKYNHRKVNLSTVLWVSHKTEQVSASACSRTQYL